MKRIHLASVLLALPLLFLPGCTPKEDEQLAAKPVIYLYPEEAAEVTLKLDYPGELLCTYPAYEDGWQVTAYPDGTLLDGQGQEYSYLFWEGADDLEYPMEEGFVVRGTETAAFLREKLALLGLTPREYNEFIVYWLPQMEGNPYNLITFQQDAYTETVGLEVTPAPDSVLRVFMVYKPLREPLPVKEPALPSFTRKGFTVVEWGGTALPPD